jgi:toxin ParE1/3/4
MDYKLIIRPLAEEDLKEAKDWYDLQLEGLGEKFVQFVDKKVLEVLKNPKHYQVKYKNVRTTLVDKFPYNIHFTIIENNVVIHSFYHTSRNPRKILKRLK